MLSWSAYHYVYDFTAHSKHLRTYFWFFRQLSSDYIFQINK